MPDDVYQPQPGDGNYGYNWSGYAEYLASTKNSTKTCNLIINYSANGYNGEAAENPPSSTVRSYTGKSVALTLRVTVSSGDDMSNAGYVFVGWATTNISSSVSYNPGDTISYSWAEDAKGNHVVKLYAVWTDQNVISYHPDANSEEANTIYQVKQSGQAATIKSAAFTRVGHTQIGWSTTPGGSKDYDFGSSYSSDEALHLYPVWAANTYTVSYYSNGGTGSMSSQTVTYGSSFTPFACSFSRTGYTFSSWNEQSDGKGIRWNITSYTFLRTENIELHAIWKGNQYTVSYNANYQGADNSLMAPSVATFGDSFYTRRNQYTRFGYTFNGWNTAADGSGSDWLPSGVSMDTYKRTEDAMWNLSQNVVLYAKWDSHIYPYGRCFFNGKDTSEFGIFVEKLPSYFYAERPFNHKAVNGKNGDVLLDPGRYENVKKVYRMVCYDSGRSFYESAVALSTWLHSAGSDYLRLEDSYEPGSYRMAVYEEANEIENIEGAAGKVEVTFSCMPQRFLISGDDVVTISTSGSTIYNPTIYDAKPLIRIEGVGNVVVNGRTIQIANNYNELIVDCEKGSVEDLSGARMDYFIYCDLFPVLKPGFNTISFTSDITSVKITPRWWIL